MYTIVYIYIAGNTHTDTLPPKRALIGRRRQLSLPSDFLFNALPRYIGYHTLTLTYTYLYIYINI